MMMGGSAELKMIAMMHSEVIETLIIFGAVVVALLLLGWVYRRWYGVQSQTPLQIDPARTLCSGSTQSDRLRGDPPTAHQ